MIPRFLAAGVILLGLGGAVQAAEPVTLSDQALDAVTAGFARNGFAVGTTFGGFSFGRTGSFTTSDSAAVTASESVVNGVASSSIKGSSTATGTAIANGPGATAVEFGGGTLVSLF